MHASKHSGGGGYENTERCSTIMHMPCCAKIALPVADLGPCHSWMWGCGAGMSSGAKWEFSMQSGMLAAAAFDAHTSAKLLQCRLRLHLSLPLLHISAC